MQTVRYLDAFDLEAEREGNAIQRFRKEIGKSIGRVGTPRAKTRKRSFDKKNPVNPLAEFVRRGK